MRLGKKVKEHLSTWGKLVKLKTFFIDFRTELLKSSQYVEQKKELFQIMTTKFSNETAISDMLITNCLFQIYREYLIAIHTDVKVIMSSMSKEGKHFHLSNCSISFPFGVKTTQHFILFEDSKDTFE